MLLSYSQIKEQTEINLNIDALSLKALTDLNLSTDKVVSDAQSCRVIVKKDSQTEIFGKAVKGDNKYESICSVSYLQEVIALYKDRYVFQRKSDK